MFWHRMKQVRVVVREEWFVAIGNRTRVRSLPFTIARVARTSEDLSGQLQ
jgi:hypothetical protein